jgi:hypothetical protein
MELSHYFVPAFNPCLIHALLKMLSRITSYLRCQVILHFSLPTTPVTPDEKIIIIIIKCNRYFIEFIKMQRICFLFEWLQLQLFSSYFTTCFDKHIREQALLDLRQLRAMILQMTIETIDSDCISSFSCCV